MSENKPINSRAKIEKLIELNVKKRVLWGLSLRPWDSNFYNFWVT